MSEIETTLLARSGIEKFGLEGIGKYNQMVFKELLYLCLVELAKEPKNKISRREPALRLMVYTHKELESTECQILELANHWSNDVESVFAEVLKNFKIPTMKGPYKCWDEEKGDSAYYAIYDWLKELKGWEW